MTLSHLGELFGWFILAVEIALRLVALGVIPGNRKPSTGMAWLLLIFIEPIIGFAIFLFVGRAALERRRAGRQRRAVDVMRARAAQLPPSYDRTAMTPVVATIADLNTHLGALPMTGGNRVELCPDYHAVIARMAAEVDRATSYVHVEFYILAWDAVTDPLFAALARAAERGIGVRVLFDHLGSRRISGYRNTLERLRATRIEWHPMLPVFSTKQHFRRPDLRNHRKLLVIDGLAGFTGSLNLIEPGYGKPRNHRVGREWVELMVRVEGHAVHALNAVFASDWYAETAEALTPALPPAPARQLDAGETGLAGVPCQVLPSGPGLVAENNLRMFTSLIYTATERISLTSPYFVPDESLLYAVTTAAHRGVAVELFVSEVSDQFMVGHAQASYYRALLEAGVRIYEYPAPYILHSKHFTIDDQVAVIGSSNMDMRSFALNFEISMMMPDPQVVTAMRRVEDRYRLLSRELTLDAWARRSPARRYVDNVMRLTAALQ